jgi:metal-responsive CopG/Arc/MetJ family transcriptional regulator
VGGKETKGFGIVLGDDLNHDMKLAASELGISRNELIRRVMKQALTEKQQPVTIPKKGGRRGKK